MMNPEKLVEELTRACPEGLVSVILYGSAAAGDHAGKRSDYNVLVVAEALDLGTMDRLSRAATKWARAGNPAPLLFTRERLAQATDVFPIELLDIRACHRVLWGEDVVRDLAIDARNLRLQLEHELRGNLIRLRQGYLLTRGRPRAVATLATGSLSTFLVLFRAALRLFEPEVPQRKFEALARLATHVEFDERVFDAVRRLTARGAGRGNAVSVFEAYLETIERVVDAVDAYIHKGGTT